MIGQGAWSAVAPLLRWCGQGGHAILSRLTRELEDPRFVSRGAQEGDEVVAREDLIRFLRATGHEPKILHLPEPPAEPTAEASASLGA